MDLSVLLALLPESLKHILQIVGSVLVVLEVAIALPEMAKAQGLVAKLKALPVVLSVISALESLSLIKPKA